MEGGVNSQIYICSESRPPAVVGTIQIDTLGFDYIASLSLSLSLSPCLSLLFRSFTLCVGGEWCFLSSSPCTRPDRWHTSSPKMRSANCRTPCDVEESENCCIRCRLWHPRTSRPCHAVARSSWTKSGESSERWLSRT